MIKVLRFLILVCLFSLVGCGSGGGGGGEGLNGAVTVTGAQSDSEQSSDVSFTISYTHPTQTNLVGTPISYTVYLPDGTSFGDSVNTNNSGSFLTPIFTIQKIPNIEQKVSCVASSANLNGRDVVTVSKLAPPTLSVLPASDTFIASDAVGSTKTFTITGGTPNYNAFSSISSVVSVSVSGNIVTATRLAAGANTVAITVQDADGATAAVSLTLQ